MLNQLIVCVRWRRATPLWRADAIQFLYMRAISEKSVGHRCWSRACYQCGGRNTWHSWVPPPSLICASFVYAKHFYLCAKYLAHTKCAIFISIYRSRFIVARTHTAEFPHVARLRRTHQINLIYAPPAASHVCIIGTKRPLYALACSICIYTTTVI